MLKANEFDLLISDIAMPDMDGHELVTAFRELPDKHTIPAIALTGFGRRHNQDKALNAGFDAHIGKPVSLEDLRKTINELGHREDFRRTDRCNCRLARLSYSSSVILIHRL